MTEKLERTLRTRDLAVICVGTVIGSGIFIVPATVLRQIGGDPMVALAVWIIAGVLSLLGALTYGELGAMQPEAGGLYVYMRDGFGRMLAFLYGWTLCFVIASGSIATLAVAAAGFVGHIFFGVFFGVGLGLGLLNALLVRRAVESITMEDHPLKKKMAVNSATRLLVSTAVGLAIAIFFKGHGGIAVLFGLAIFQALLVMSTSIPVLRKIRANGLDVEDVPASDSKG